ncbi:MAG: pectate lyase, partial [Prevotella sp.]|nr:pectate lyase [Prevotella sp.]
MIKKLFTILSIALFGVTAAQAQAPAFPGAEGHGRYVTGGRGGKVIHVTNLNDSGTGSLRAAVSGSAKKIIVFDVGGVIELKSDLKIGENTTILGQTAPNPGITLRYFTVRPGTNENNNNANIIIRFIRIRRGQEKDVNDGADATWQRRNKNIIFDHCSFSWSIDEIASFYDNQNFTMQWCTLGEALANAGHTKEEHSYGGIWGGKGASFHHNFLCHMQNRVPRFCGARYNSDNYDKSLYANAIQAEIVDFRNCVMYNWGNGNGCYGGTGGGHINIVNNYYKAGPATVNTKRVTQISVATSSNASGSDFMGYCSRYYINGNYITAAGSEAENYDWKGVIYDSGTSTID